MCKIIAVANQKVEFFHLTEIICQRTGVSKTENYYSEGSFIAWMKRHIEEVTW